MILTKLMKLEKGAGIEPFYS